MKYSILISILFLHFASGYFFKEKNQYIRIDLMRQKSPRRQLVNHQNILAKYGLDVKGPKPPRTNDTISLFRYMDNEFYGKIVIGKPGKTMNVAFDTAWDVSWVLSSRCQVYITPGCAGHNLYNHNGSSSYKENGTLYNANEGTYNLTGFYSYDNISMAHSNVTNFLFVEMVDVPAYMASNKADGVLGLGLRTGDYEPFLYTLYRQKKIKNLLFSVYLNRDPQSTKGGNIMLGFVDKKHIHIHQLPNGAKVYDNITYLQVDAGQYWMFSVDKIDLVFTKRNKTTFCPNGCKAVADTSSNDIIGPESVINQIHDSMNAKKFEDKWVVDCDKISKLPKIDLYLGGNAFRLEGRNYIKKEKNDTLPYFLCVSAFTPSSTTPTEGLWVLGGAFLSQYYSIYNINEKTIGFVRAA
ncbi:unnamed protein product [Phyllotreta striolata]|uniref:Peptidase A1 domain-containing protein n=1 Tax=Phyllotreta striolata TaxID=444603 RepID=A0A9N9TV78_PHYSR|nr:unnamed protein product [Phyllotreta striolata]